MSLRRQIVSGFRALVRPAKTDRDVADEIEHYLAEATTAYRERGLSDHEARRAAQLDFGSRTAIRQEIRAARLGDANRVVARRPAPRRQASEAVARSPP